MNSATHGATRRAVSRDLILVVDDLAENLALMRTQLEGLGYHVVTAPDAETAMAHIEAELPRAVIIDLLMPGVDGLEMCRRLRQNPRTAALPIIAVTAATDPKMRLQALRAGADEFLARPLDWVELHVRLRALRLGLEGKVPMPAAEVPRPSDSEGAIDLLAHDLKSPLSIVMGVLELFDHSDVAADPTVSNRLMRRALEASQRQMRLIDEMIDLLRVEAGVLEWNCEAVDLSGVVARALTEATGAIEAKRLHVIDHVPDDLPPVAADADLVRRVLLSLIDNVLRFSLQGGTLQISAAVAGAPAQPVCVLEMADDGRPVLPAYTEAIFDRAAQWRARRDGSRSSVALGLPFCRAALQLMGGEVAVRSVAARADGSQTVFTLTLPAYLPAG